MSTRCNENTTSDPALLRQFSLAPQTTADRRMSITIANPKWRALSARRSEAIGIGRDTGIEANLTIGEHDVAVCVGDDLLEQMLGIDLDAIVTCDVACDYGRWVEHSEYGPETDHSYAALRIRHITPIEELGSGSPPS
ncbi:MAG: hypothetical protein KGJ62_15550 [Armatimonadetes bacterium]|nr:hypothetical protein [Armatimonadota bacterium]MDE2206983.1 hypothetical protein [Armatimonadota bacterium]